jgi:hypothetical protein
MPPWGRTGRRRRRRTRAARLTAMRDAGRRGGRRGGRGAIGMTGPSRGQARGAVIPRRGGGGPAGPGRAADRPYGDAGPVRHRTPPPLPGAGHAAGGVPERAGQGVRGRRPARCDSRTPWTTRVPSRTRATRGSSWMSPGSARRSKARSGHRSPDAARLFRQEDRGDGRTSWRERVRRGPRPGGVTIHELEVLSVEGPGPVPHALLQRDLRPGRGSRRRRGAGWGPPDRAASHRSGRVLRRGRGRGPVGSLDGRGRADRADPAAGALTTSDRELTEPEEAAAVRSRPASRPVTATRHGLLALVDEGPAGGHRRGRRDVLRPRKVFA